MANEVFDKKPQVRFRRNSDAPLLYAPLIDVRTSRRPRPLPGWRYVTGTTHESRVILGSSLMFDARAWAGSRGAKGGHGDMALQGKVPDAPPHRVGKTGLRGLPPDQLYEVRRGAGFDLGGVGSGL